MCNKLTATKEFTWDMAHALAGHQGLCRNLHGHTYKMEVTATRIHEDIIEDGPSEGMVLDFKDLKNVIKELIVDPLDHATMVNILNDDPFEKELFELLTKYDRKLYKVCYRPTAENMAKHFINLLNGYLIGINAGYTISKIRLYETPTSYAEVE